MRSAGVQIKGGGGGGGGNLTPVYVLTEVGEGGQFPLADYVWRDKICAGGHNLLRHLRRMNFTWLRYIYMKLFLNLPYFAR